METIEFKHIHADAFSGALWALDGVKDGLVILNGPTGCKFYHASISNGQFCRGTSYNPAQIDEEFSFRQNRIPCTYLDGNDFVYGSEEKLRKALQSMLKPKHAYVAVVNSPGAALIGDNLEGILRDELNGTPYIAIENSGFSESYYQGFQKAGIQLLNSLKLEKKAKEKLSVNLIGFSIYQKHYEGNAKELKRLLSLLGINVICTPLAGCSTADLRDSAAAELNIVLAPEAGQKIAGWYQENLQIPYLELPVPIGFDATENWINAICDKLNLSSKPAIDDINYSRAISFRYLQSLNSLSGYPKGTIYGVKADYTVARGLFNFLTPYLGMLPSSIEFSDACDEKLKSMLDGDLKSRDMFDGLGTVTDQEYHILFGDGNTIAQQKALGKTFTGVEIALPSLGYTDVIPKAIMGTQGTLYLLEQIINGLKFFCK